MTTKEAAEKANVTPETFAKHARKAGYKPGQKGSTTKYNFSDEMVDEISEKIRPPRSKKVGLLKTVYGKLVYYKSMDEYIRVTPRGRLSS
ncbi:MAG: hypothetical protein GY804_10035 [Alphaproteobacteria bacterium]|nr:hypothetical protein [Alphaproteobacteria bacterium]